MLEGTKRDTNFEDDLLCDLLEGIIVSNPKIRWNICEYFLRHNY